METFTSCLSQTIISRVHCSSTYLLFKSFQVHYSRFPYTCFLPQNRLIFRCSNSRHVWLSRLALWRAIHRVLFTQRWFSLFSRFSKGLSWRRLFYKTSSPLLMLIFVAQSLSFSFSYLFVFAQRFFVHPLLFAFAFSLDAQFSSGKRALGSRVAEFQIELGKGRTQHRLKLLLQKYYHHQNLLKIEQILVSDTIKCGPILNFGNRSLLTSTGKSICRKRKKTEMKIKSARTCKIVDIVHA